MTYIPGEKNIIQTIIHRNYCDFEKKYNEVYAKDYGIYRLERIIESINKLIDCSDWLQGIARIQCTNPDCKNDFYHVNIKNTAGLTQTFRRQVIKLFVDWRLLNKEFAKQLLTWKNSGFSPR